MLVKMCILFLSVLLKALLLNNLTFIFFFFFCLLYWQSSQVSFVQFICHSQQETFLSTVWIFSGNRSLWKRILWVVWLSPERKDECDRQRILQSSKNRKRPQQISGVQQSGLFRSRQFCSTTQWPLARITARKWTAFGFSGPSQFSQE